MKVRSGFVSNSSSSSFIIMKKHLSDKQVKLIRCHILKARKNRSIFGYTNDCDEWKIIESDDTISGSTSMNNFDMARYLNDFVGISDKYIQWSK